MPANESSRETPEPVILLIDDEQLVHQFVCAFLSDNYGFKVISAFSGAEGKLLARLEPVELILLDVRLPGEDGYEVCRALKHVPKLRDVPVLFFSALGDAVSKVRGFEAGGVDFITKPVNCEELCARVMVHLQLQRRHSSMAYRLEAYQRCFGRLPVLESAVNEGRLAERHVRMVERAREIIEQHLQQPPPVSEIASQVGTNAKRLTADFKILFGMGVAEWIREQRMQRGCKLLAESDLSVEQIAAEVGFSTGANFATAFRQRFQLTPRAFRNGK